MLIELSERDIAQVLAALRNWQIDSMNEDLANEFADHFEGIDPMDDDQIDDLCERLSVGTEAGDA